MIAVSEPASFSGRVALPLSCEKLDGPPSNQAREEAAWANDGVLAFLLHELDAEASVRPVDERLAEALAPLRGKLDLVVEMLGRLSYRDVRLPPVRMVDLGLTRIGWLSSAAVEPGQWVRLQLYFHPTYLEPLTLYGSGASCVEAEGGYQLQVEIETMPEARGEAFARLAFRAQRRELQHRSAVAVGGGRR